MAFNLTNPTYKKEIFKGENSLHAFSRVGGSGGDQAGGSAPKCPNPGRVFPGSSFYRGYHSEVERLTEQMERELEEYLNEP